MNKVFISYRRDDSEEMASRIARTLKNHFGHTNVVLDTDTFLLGNDFQEDIMTHLTSSNVVLVVIGEFWVSILNERRRNRPLEIDWVLREIETALNKGKIVIPLTIDDTFLPSYELLPSSIQELCNQNGMAINTRPSKFDADTQRLIQKIEQRTKTFMKPEPNTKEYLNYLLLNSKWNIQASRDSNEVYLCEQDTAYNIVVDILSEDHEDNYTSSWADHFVGTHRIYPVYVKHNESIIDKTYFVSIWGAKYFVPIASIDGTLDQPIYFWDVHSIELRLARHIARFHTLYKTIEEFADHAEIKIRE